MFICQELKPHILLYNKVSKIKFSVILSSQSCKAYQDENVQKPLTFAWILEIKS